MAMRGKDKSSLRSGFTTGACATAAAAAAATTLITGNRVDHVRIRLPNGQVPAFEIEEQRQSPEYCEAGVRKDAGDDPDVTHHALIRANVRQLPQGSGVVISGGEGVGTVTREGLPIAVGQPAINPVPRRMITEMLMGIAAEHSISPDFAVEISVPGGEELAKKTWNPRLGIMGGISILGTTGIVKPYSCAAWITSIHRGVDVARAGDASHVVASTGSQSERLAQAYYGLPDWVMLDMGDFVGGLLKYLRRHPLPFLTVAGGFGKISKLAGGEMDLHSARSQVDFASLGEITLLMTENRDRAKAVRGAHTAMQALEIGGDKLAQGVAQRAAEVIESTLGDANIAVEVMIFDRSGNMVARYSRTKFPDGQKK